MISHDVDVYTGTSRPAAGTFLTAIGTVPANTPSASGRIAIPSHNIPSPIAEPTFSFIPDAALGEWLRGIQIHRSDWRVTAPQHAHCTYVTEHDLRDYMNDYLAGTLSRIFNWTASRADDRYFGFDITAQFTNETQLEARSVIITESEAAALIDFRCVVVFNEAAGRPFFTHTITDAVLDAIRAALPEGDIIRIHPITYGAGAVSTPAHQALTVNVVVVRDGSVLAPDRSFGIFAQDATMGLGLAQSITRAALDADHTRAIAFDSEGNTFTPDIAAGAVADINATTAAQVPRNVSVGYSFLPASSEAAPVSITVTVTVVADYPDFIFTKMSNYTDAPMAGVEFRLYPRNAADTAWDSAAVIIRTSAANGVVNFDLLRTGTYLLRESQTLAGYELVLGYWIVVVDADAETVVVTAQSNAHGFTYDDGNRYLLNFRGANVDLTVTKEVMGSSSSFAYNFTLLNRDGDPVLPFGPVGSASNLLVLPATIVDGAGVATFIPAKEIAIAANGTFQMADFGGDIASLTLHGLPSSWQVRVVKDDPAGYDVSFIDSINPAVRVLHHDTGIRTIGAVDRTFDFLSERQFIPTGFFFGGGAALMVVLASGGTIAAVLAVRRRKEIESLSVL